MGLSIDPYDQRLMVVVSSQVELDFLCSWCSQNNLLPPWIGDKTNYPVACNPAEGKWTQKLDQDYQYVKFDQFLISVIEKQVLSLRNNVKHFAELRSGFWDVIFHTDIDVLAKRGFATYYRSADQYVVENGGESTMKLFNDTCRDCGYTSLIRE